MENQIWNLFFNVDANSVLYSLICIILRCTLVIVGFYIGRVLCRFLQTISQDSRLWSSLQFLNSAESNSTPHSTSTRVVHQIVHQRKISIRFDPSVFNSMIACGSSFLFASSNLTSSILFVSFTFHVLTACHRQSPGRGESACTREKCMCEKYFRCRVSNPGPLVTQQSRTKSPVINNRRLSVRGYRATLITVRSIRLFWTFDR